MFFSTSLATDFIARVCSLNTHDDADHEILAMVDHVIVSGQQHQLQSIRRRLVLLYEHWTLNLPTCTSLATGIEGGQLPQPSYGRRGCQKDLSISECWLSVSRNTLWRRLKETGVTLEKYSTILCDDELDERLRVLRLRYPNCGQIMLRSMLSAQGIHIQRHRLRESIDPDRTYSRWRQYCLIRWCMVIHGCIDGFSRLVLYLQCENNCNCSLQPRRSMACHLGYVQTKAGKISVSVSICFAIVVLEDIAGKSTHNQRIERLWRDVFRCTFIVSFISLRKVKILTQLMMSIYYLK